MASRPFVDQPVGDLVAAGALAARVSAELDLPNPTLLRAGMNALFRAGQLVIRVGRPSAPAELAIELAERLRDRGIPAPVPACRSVVVDRGLAATCWAPLADSGAPVDWRGVGAIVRRVHALSADDVPAGYPVPPPTTFPWWDFEALMADVGSEIDDAARAGLAEAIERNAAWRSLEGECVICHGDVHPGNVMMTAEGPVLIDWDLMCTAPAAWDHAMLLTLADRWGGDRRVYAEFAEGYGRSFAEDVEARRFAELRNVAATLMRVRAGRSDPAAADEAQRRLRYWRGDPDAPSWRAQ
jgi:hypothetical protein